MITSRKVRSPIILAVAITAVGHLAVPRASQAADLYRVAGVVLNTQTKTPLPHAEVYIFKAGTPAPRAPFFPGDDGRFSFDVPPGVYNLRAGTRFLQGFYGELVPGNGLGSSIIVGPGQDTGNLVFNWLPSAAISGRIVDDAGEPVEGALAQLIRSTIVLGRRVTMSYRYTRSNDKGEYRFGIIPGAGNYYVAITGTPWYEAARARVGLRDSNDRPVAFIPVYYPNTTDASQAAPITVHPGDEARADFTLISAAGATITVTHSGPADLKGNLSLTSDGILGTDAFQVTQALTAFSVPKVPAGQVLPNQVTPNPPRQQLAGVPPGHYTAKITGGNGSVNLSGRATVDVNGSDITVDVPMRPAATVSGNVRFESPAGRPATTVRAILTQEGAGGVMNALVRPDGSFVFPAIADGRFRAGVGGIAGWFVSHIDVKGTDFRDGLMTLAAGDAVTVSITLSDASGGVNGVVLNGDKAMPAVLVVLVPLEESPNLVRSQGYQTESDGSFDYRNIPAGRYYLFAADNLELEYGNPAAVRPYLADAKLITVTTRGTTTERISLAAAK